MGLLQNSQGDTFYHVFDFFFVRQHVGGMQMAMERFNTLPFLNHDYLVVIDLLNWHLGINVNRWKVLHAAGFLSNHGNIVVEDIQEFFSPTRLQFDGCHDIDHLTLKPVRMGFQVISFGYAHLQ